MGTFFLEWSDISREKHRRWRFNFLMWYDLHMKFIINLINGYSISKFLSDSFITIYFGLQNGEPTRSV